MKVRRAAWRRASLRQRILIISALVVTTIASGQLFDRIPIRNLARADATKVVSLSNCGVNRIVTTDASTVGDVLKRANIILGEGDIVEPTAATAVPNGFFNVNIYCSLPYRIIDGANVHIVQSAQQAPRLIAADAKVTVYPEDEVSVEAVNNFVVDRVVGHKIAIKRAKSVQVTADGQAIPLRTQAATVGQFLHEKNISLGERDTVTPALGTAITDGLKVNVTRVAVVVSVREEAIVRATKKVSDPNKLRGVVELKDEGVDGKQKVTYELTYNNGVVVKTKKLATELLAESKPRVELVGTKVFYPNEIVAMAGAMAAERGWVNEQWDALYNLWTKEANFNPAAANPTTGACGIPQAYPCSKLPGFPGDPKAQINWGLNYITQRYGDPINAWSYWKSHNSY